MPVHRAELSGWAGTRSPTPEGGREGCEGTVDSLEIDQREGFRVWQRSRRATRSTDPGRSAWWIAFRIIGAVLGAITPFIVKPGMPWPVLGVFALAGSLLSQPAISALQDWVSKKSKDRRLTESSGIYDSLVGKKLNELRVHNSDRDISEFLPRDAQKKLIQNIEDRTPTLIVGPSMSGKTRLVVETVRKNYPSTPVWFPKGNDDIQRLVDAAQGPRRGSIIILDDVDRFLSNQTLSLGQLNAWIREPCIVIATMMRSSYIPWRDGAKDKLPGWDVVNRFTTIQMDALLTENEQAALSRSSSYADLAAAAEKVGLAPLLGGAPKLRQRLEEGREQHLWGYALVRAAADWRRVGLGPATKTQIQEVALTLKDDIAWGEPNWKKAWKWASHKLNDTVSLIRQTGPREWEVLDLVADEADWSLSQQILRTMADTEHSPHQALAISLAMYMNQALDNDSVVVKKILKEADEFLHELITKSTYDSNSLGLYAFFLTDVHSDHDRAETMYERAIKADPNHAINLGNYALFLTDVRHKHDRAETMYERAIKADPNHAINLGNYANFLTDVRHKHDQAQDMYNRAINADPTNANNLGNYANFLWTIRSDHDQAQDMYNRAINVSPNHTRNLSNYALFLTDVRHDHDQAQDMCDRAQEMFEQAINVDPTNAINLGNYANFLWTIRSDHDQAQDMYDRAIKADPNHANNLGNYSQILFATGRDEAATALATRALPLAGPDEKPLVAECRFYLFAHSPQHRRKSGKRLRDLLAAGVTTGSWSFEPDLERLRREKDPRYDLVRDVADALRSGDARTLEARGEWYAL